MLDVDLEGFQKQYRVQLNTQMFTKSNPKGMALIIHTLLCLFNEEEYTPMFSVCWFPYSMVEMKEFKQIALNICLELIKQGRFQSGIITKAVLESASGVRMWQALRSLSDYCIMDRMRKEHSKAELRSLPVFIQSVLQAFEG